MEHCRLPLELLELIITYTIPDHDLALPSHSAEVKTLHSCLFLCKGTVPFVQELLYRSCLYIDDPLQLHQLVRSYSIETPLSLRKPRKIFASQRMLLAPFSGYSILEPEVVTNLSLLFQIIGPNLKHLTIDMPLRYNPPLDPEDEDMDPDPSPIRTQLRSAFTNLTGLKELVSIKDELYLASTFHLRIDQPQIWPNYSFLKRLALYNSMIDDILVEGLKALPNLTNLVLTRPDSDGAEGLLLLTHLRKPLLKIVIFTTWEDLKNCFWNLSWYPRTSISPQDVDADELAKIRTLCYEDVMGLSRGPHAVPQFDEVAACQNWIRCRALDGTLWDHEGITLDRTGRELNDEELYS
ncbi:hypothetical protein HII31_12968 [Pseudocercospora fuligena]|uniref:F-box domain-containing protein n=1 Tax=Pseudocercospora fuligena TaxID=685502 RepID=A0A8H6R8F8_9PEZI|nr:hypothetical protein HII31_12968 [Pseudocercospora fuligena]